MLSDPDLAALWMAAKSMTSDGRLALLPLADWLEMSGPYEPYHAGGGWYGWWRGLTDGPDGALPVELFDRLPRKVTAANQLFSGRRDAYLALAEAVADSPAEALAE